MSALVNTNQFRVFSLLWFGQSVSLFGSALTTFALGVWVFERSQSITLFAMLGLSAVLPRVLLSPMAGVVVDRWDRRAVMLVSDSVAGVGTLVTACLAISGLLELWMVYPLAAVLAAAGTLQWPAYTATTTLLVAKEQLGRVNGMQQLGQAFADVFAPALAAVLLPVIQLHGVFLIDFATFIVAVITLLSVRFPRHHSRKDELVEMTSWWRDLSFGWRYVRTRAGLLGLLSLLAIVNFIWSMVGALITPMILSFASSQTLGVIISIAGAGLLTGGLVMSLWGGPQPRILGVLNFELLSGLCFFLIGFRPNFWPISIGVFGAHLTIAIIYGSNQAIWQSKVPPDVQGRVFATQQMLIKATAPLAFLLAGPLAERVFEPLMGSGSIWSGRLSMLLGSGAGRGIGLMFVLMGIAKVAVTLTGYFQPRIRNIETELPDAMS